MQYSLDVSSSWRELVGGLPDVRLFDVVQRATISHPRSSRILDRFPRGRVTRPDGVVYRGWLTQRRGGGPESWQESASAAHTHLLEAWFAGGCERRRQVAVREVPVATGCDVHDILAVVAAQGGWWDSRRPG
jgi:hypothetical protein